MQLSHHAVQHTAVATRDSTRSLLLQKAAQMPSSTACKQPRGCSSCSAFTRQLLPDPHKADPQQAKSCSCSCRGTCHMPCRAAAHAPAGRKGRSAARLAAKQGNSHSRCRAQPATEDALMPPPLPSGLSPHPTLFQGAGVRAPLVMRCCYVQQQVKAVNAQYKSGTGGVSACMHHGRQRHNTVIPAGCSSPLPPPPPLLQGALSSTVPCTSCPAPQQGEVPQARPLPRSSSGDPTGGSSTPPAAPAAGRAHSAAHTTTRPSPVSEVGRLTTHSPQHGGDAWVDAVLVRHRPLVHAQVRMHSVCRVTQLSCHR
jgi:hypothetical protein